MGPGFLCLIVLEIGLAIFGTIRRCQNHWWNFEVHGSLLALVDTSLYSLSLTFLQISDARITITEPKPGATDTVIIISGTPEQTHAAQSLIQAFVMIESESA